MHYSSYGREGYAPQYGASRSACGAPLPGGRVDRGGPLPAGESCDHSGESETVRTPPVHGVAGSGQLGRARA